MRGFSSRFLEMMARFGNMVLNYAEIYIILALQYLVVLIFRDTIPWLSPFVFVVSFIGAEFYFEETSLSCLKRNIKQFIFYLVIYTSSIFFLILTLYSVVVHYTWGAWYRFFKFLGITMFSQDVKIVHLLVIIFFLVLCDFISKLILIKMTKEKFRGALSYLGVILVLFVTFSLLILLTCTDTFREFESLKLPFLLINATIWIFVRICQDKYDFTINYLLKNHTYCV